MITIGGNDMNQETLNNTFNPDNNSEVNNSNLTSKETSGFNQINASNNVIEKQTNNDTLNNQDVGTVASSLDNQTQGNNENQTNNQGEEKPLDKDVSSNDVNSKKANPITDNKAKKSKTKSESSFLQEFFLSILNIFYLAYRGISYPLSTLFNVSSKTVDEAYQQAKFMNKKKEKKSDDLEVIVKKIKDFLGITQKEV